MQSLTRVSQEKNIGQGGIVVWTCSTYKTKTDCKVKHHLTCFNNIFSNNELISNQFAVFVTCTHILAYLWNRLLIDFYLCVYDRVCKVPRVLFTICVWNESWIFVVVLNFCRTVSWMYNKGPLGNGLTRKLNQDLLSILYKPERNIGFHWITSYILYKTIAGVHIMPT
jgi:hypothetical protein